VGKDVFGNKISRLGNFVMIDYFNTDIGGTYFALLSNEKQEMVWSREGELARNQIYFLFQDKYLIVSGKFTDDSFGGCYIIDCATGETVHSFERNEEPSLKQDVYVAGERKLLLFQSGNTLLLYQLYY
jgi:hypothetical protein